MELTYKLEELPKAVDTVLKQLNSKVVCFYGDMGAGKTTFIKAIVKALGSNDVVSSPTFSLVNPYVTEKDTIYHFDLYRVQDVEELYQIGIEDYLDSDAWILIEWPQIIADLLPETHSALYFSTVNNDVRSLKLTENYCLT
ncbi:tRNA (adenosine(37)-N6)-threonylcarbamoyltransferase complex ATPase subunit type 1 TsaE [Paucihalobacter ruber]|uniref:tRNA threonylcarbamoyladenosine biosynthesis protein TsaE n=1 Tax=Paucihalobacter ruber TaxID=2567861 RepID=A0A506PEL9_9FLAO|nr:tRNA (adenosine(37)-N6)-threonylcarbamoyltransferase complex ATPase subunit type 1 TsaE [Paucihalobacter ruber]TPV31517.1 tRNA (adenosine(37)-N6)-threonylcarbamoyltransferase complex ATPase subunit type 1 TsaE [Paucihalobacter ruber]